MARRHHATTPDSFVPVFVGKPFRNMPEHKGMVVPIYHEAPPCPTCGRSHGQWLVAHVYENAIGKENARKVADAIAKALNRESVAPASLPTGAR